MEDSVVQPLPLLEHCQSGNNESGILLPLRRRLSGKHFVPDSSSLGNEADSRGSICDADESAQPVDIGVDDDLAEDCEVVAADGVVSKRQLQAVVWSRMRNLFIKDCLASRVPGVSASSHTKVTSPGWRQNRKRLGRLYGTISDDCRRDLARRCAEEAEAAGAHPQLVAMFKEKAEVLPEGKPLTDRRMGALLTYNGEWGVLHNVVIPPTPLGDDRVEHVCRVLAMQPAVNNTGLALKQHVERIVKKHKLARWSCCVELCPESVPEVAQTTFVAQDQVCQTLRVHAHVFLEASQPFSLHSSAAELLFLKSGPHLSEDGYAGQGGRGRGHKTAMAAGHYYCQAPKLSRVWGACSHCVYSTVGLKAEWVTTYWSQKKMSDAAAIKEYLHVRRDARRHIQNVQDVRAFSRQQDMAQRALAVRVRLADSKAPRLWLQEVDQQFLPQFADNTLHRRKFLVLDGGSGFGKTEFARCLARTPLSFLELNCANTEHVDLRAFSPVDHDLIIWDECPAALVLKFKKLFQGQASDVMLGQTNTSQHAYTVFVWNVKMVVCSNLWKLQLRVLCHEDAAWLEQNSIYVHVTAPLWRTPLGGE